MEEKNLYEKNKPELDAGLKGIKLALKILNDYFSKNAESSSSGSGSGIIGMLEVVESDLTKSLAELQASEDLSERTHDKLSQQNYITKTMKEEMSSTKPRSTMG